MLEKFVKECFFIALWLFLIFVMENYDYFFHYLPHRGEYSLFDAQKYIYQKKNSRNIYIFFYDGGERVEAKVPEAAGDARRNKIKVAYSRFRGKVIRADYIVKTELYVVGILVIILQIRRYFMLKKYCEELIEYPR